MYVGSMLVVNNSEHRNVNSEIFKLLYVSSNTNNQRVSIADWICVCQHVCDIVFKTEASQTMIKAFRP
jgi:hypothetical protein